MCNIGLLFVYMHLYTPQVYARLNHVCVSLSYTTTLKVVDQISTLHKPPLQMWLASGAPVKFVGDNVQKNKGVRDVRSDHQKSMLHKYSMLVVKGRVSDPSLQTTGSTLDFKGGAPSPTHIF